MNRSEYAEKTEYLSRYLKNRATLRRIDAELAEVLNYTPTAARMQAAVARSHEKADLADYAVKVEGIEEQLQAAKQKCIHEMDAITAAIDGTEIEQPLRDILHYKYIVGLTIEEIAERMTYSPRHIVRLHTEAIELFSIPAGQPACSCCGSGIHQAGYLISGKWYCRRCIETGRRLIQREEHS